MSKINDTGGGSEAAEDKSATSTSRTNCSVWSNLVRWVQGEHGGSIHERLRLEGGSANDDADKPRGIFATGTIAKGEWLIRLPASCVVSGISIADNKESSPASSWLRCVVAYYQAVQNPQQWNPYLDSLPDYDEYETLFHWSDEQVEKFLSGTTTGSMVIADRKEGTLMKRYLSAVRPYLRKFGQVSAQDDAISKEEFDTFLQACMCISTRGFHMKTDVDGVSRNGSTDNSYQGPFLLPVIDLLNHDPANKCTTLQVDDATGMFCMQAERDIDAGEEVFHSYGDSLTAAQLLQTFGFVPSRSLQSTGAGKLGEECTTPAVLSKKEHLLAACEYIKASDLPREIRDWVSSRPTASDDDEVWDVAGIPSRPLSEEDAPNDWLISTDASMDTILTDELITFVVLQFLPQEAYDEMVLDGGRISAWLDRSILDDLYLGKLVYHAVLEAVRRKQDEYFPLVDEGGETHSTSCDPLWRDRSLLQELQSVREPDHSTLRKIYALRVRIEELVSLEALSTEIAESTKCLEREGTAGPGATQLSKRPKLK